MRSSSCDPVSPFSSASGSSPGCPSTISNIPSNPWALPRLIPGEHPQLTCSARRRPLGPPAGPAAPHQLAPVLRFDLDVEPASRRLDPLPGGVAVGVADVLDLVEPGDGVANVARVVDGLLALLGERELFLRHPVLLAGADALRAPGNAGA